MGAEIRTVDEPSSGKAGNSTGADKGQSGTSTSSADTRTGDTGRTGRTGDAGRTGTADGKTEVKSEVVSGLASVDDEEAKRQERNAKRRARYAAQKEANGGTVKPRKVNTKKAQSDVIDTTQINALIATVSAIVASRPDCEHWLLTEKEIDSITQPLAKMLAESEALSKINENSNQIALVIACVSVFAPRLFVTAQKMKEKKEREKVVRKPIEKTKGSVDKTYRGNDKRSPADAGKHLDREPFYGVPVA